MNPDLEETLNALLPGCHCPHAAGACAGLVRLDPMHGHAPRGYAGATGNLDEVRAIFVFAEPGNPYPEESYQNVSEAWEFATGCFLNGPDQFHVNVRWILEQAWPDLTPEQRLRRVYLTDSVLCSAAIEGGVVRAGVERTCVEHLFRAQRNLFPKAIVVAFGNKAQHRLERLGVDFVPAWAVAPPGSNRREAQASRQEIAQMLSQLP